MDPYQCPYLEKILRGRGQPNEGQFALRKISNKLKRTQ